MQLEELSIVVKWINKAARATYLICEWQAEARTRELVLTSSSTVHMGL